MAFWGIEVKPGKPVTHKFNEASGRLRISQATLGIGSAQGKSLVQCNVGSKSPVFLCALLPNKTESCHLDLEFEESDHVVFSVLGPRTVYLTGYYVGKSRLANVNSDTESYGEDIADTETGESCHASDEDTYEDSFINDSEPEASPPSPASRSEVQAEDEDLLDNTLHNNKKSSNRRLRKKYQMIESEDEDNCLLSTLKMKTTVKAKTSDDDQKTDILSAEIPGWTDNDGLMVHEAVNELGSVSISKLNKRKKSEGSGLIVEVDSSSDGKNYKEDKVKPVGAGMTMAFDMKDVHLDTVEPPAEVVSKHGSKSKKRKLSGEAQSVKDHGTNCDVVHAEDQAKQDTINADDLGEDPIATSEDQNLTMNKGIDGKSDCVADGCLLDKKLKKKKKKKSKTQEDEHMENLDISVLQENERNRPSTEVENKSLKANSSVIRTLSEGLIIEELAKGEADGKLAAPGKKVKVYYTGMLKENGQIFSSNIGKSPYRFRLGDKDIIEGWNLGLDGMRVGDKRRLTVPPSMGYGGRGAEENIPPNSWLVYDIELIGVRR